MREDLETLVTDNIPLARMIAGSIYTAAKRTASGRHLEFEDIFSIGLEGLVEAATKWDSYCLTPDALILTSDLRWVPIGSLCVGDELIGIDEYTLESSATSGRRFRRSEVLSASRRDAECVEITFVSGRKVKCTLDHKWLAHTWNANIGNRTKVDSQGWVRKPDRRGGWGWVSTFDLKPGSKLMSPLRVWPEDSTFKAGWLSGIIDGEANWMGEWVYYGDVTPVRARRGIAISQNPGKVFNRIKQTLVDMAIPFKENSDTHSSVLKLNIGHRRYAMELLGRVRPVRFDASELWEGATCYSKGLKVENISDVIESIVLIGSVEVVTLETTTSTYIANGLVAHNCERNAYDPKAVEFFQYYARRRINGAIYDEFRNRDWASRSLRSTLKKIWKANPNGELNNAETAALVGVSEETVKDAKSKGAPVSLDALVQEHSDGEYAGSENFHNWMLGSDSAFSSRVEQSAEASALLAVFVDEFLALPEEQRVVIALRYFDGADLKEVARIVGVTEARASSLHTKGVLALSSALFSAASK